MHECLNVCDKDTQKRGLNAGTHSLCELVCNASCLRGRSFTTHRTIEDEIRFIGENKVLLSDIDIV